MTQISPGTQAAINIINQNEAARRVARSAEMEALANDATPQEVHQAFVNAMQEQPAPPQAREYIQQAVDMLNVSPEGFVALLHTQVEREDQKVMESRNAIEQSIAKSRALSETMEALQIIHQRISQDSSGQLKIGNGDVTINGRTMNIGEAIIEFNLADELNLDASAGSSTLANITLRADSVQSAIDGVRTAQQTVTSANELNMIAMQQAMQQRGQHIQLVSKVLAMMGDTERSIVGNMR